MKLGEALLQRADLQKRLMSIKSRLAANATVQEGDKPGESPSALLEEAETLLVEFEALIVKVNLANMNATLRDGSSITATLAHRDVLILKHNMLYKLLEAMRNREERYSLKEIRYVVTASIADTQKKMDAVAAELRDLNLTLQEANWRIDV